MRGKYHKVLQIHFTAGIEIRISTPIRARARGIWPLPDKKGKVCQVNILIGFKVAGGGVNFIGAYVHLTIQNTGFTINVGLAGIIAGWITSVNYEPYRFAILVVL